MPPERSHVFVLPWELHLTGGNERSSFDGHGSWQNSIFVERFRKTLGYLDLYYGGERSPYCGIGRP
jgi:hypothetical protein